MRYVVREMVKWWHGHKVLITWVQEPQSLSSACYLLIHHIGHIYNVPN